MPEPASTQTRRLETETTGLSAGTGTAADMARGAQDTGPAVSPGLGAASEPPRGSEPPGVSPACGSVPLAPKALQSDPTPSCVGAAPAGGTDAIAQRWQKPRGPR